MKTYISQSYNVIDVVCLHTSHDIIKQGLTTDLLLYLESDAAFFLKIIEVGSSLVNSSPLVILATIIIKNYAYAR